VERCSSCWGTIAFFDQFQFLIYLQNASSTQIVILFWCPAVVWVFHSFRVFYIYVYISLLIFSNFVLFVFYFLSYYDIYSSMLVCYTLFCVYIILMEWRISIKACLHIGATSHRLQTASCYRISYLWWSEDIQAAVWCSFVMSLYICSMMFGLPKSFAD